MSSTWIMSSSSFTDWKLSFWSFLLVQRRTFEGEYETQRKMQCCSGYSAASKVATGYSQWRAMGQQVRQQASCSPIVQFSAAVQQLQPNWAINRLLDSAFHPSWERGDATSREDPLPNDSHPKKWCNQRCREKAADGRFQCTSDKTNWGSLVAKEPLLKWWPSDFVPKRNARN